MAPFIWWGRLFSSRYLRSLELDDDYDIIFFYPSAGVGGAERYNLGIVDSVPELKKLVIYTKKGDYELNKDQLVSTNATFKILADQVDNKKKYWQNLIWRGVLGQYVRDHQSIQKIFIGQCNFGYKLLPHVTRSIIVSELIHMLDIQFANVWTPFVSFLDHRVVISEIIRKEVREFYDQKKIPAKYKERIQIIPNKIPFDIPEYDTTYSEPLKVIYAGRGGPQKRLWLLNRVIENTQDLENVEYHLAGDFEDELPDPLPPNTKYYGILTAKDMPAFYQGKHALLMPSAWEGFPFAVMESMINGIVPVITAVDSVPEHIFNEKNGYLISDPENEDSVVEQAEAAIRDLAANPEKFNRISREAYDYIAGNFKPEDFDRAYRSLLLSDN